MKRVQFNSKHKLAPQAEPEPLLITRVDAARMLGTSRQTILRLEDEGKLKTVQLRKGHNAKVYIKRNDLLALIDQ